VQARKNVLTPYFTVAAGLAGVGGAGGVAGLHVRVHEKLSGALRRSLRRGGRIARAFDGFGCGMGCLLSRRKALVYAGRGSRASIY